MSKIRIGFIVIAAVVTLTSNTSVVAQDDAHGTVERKEMRAMRAANGSIKIDGRLDEPVWQQAVYVTDFAQKLPIEFATPEDSTALAIMYDDDALYVGAIMYCQDTENLRMDLSRYDDRGLGEQIIVTLDTYLDRRTGYGFGVTTAGVRFDRIDTDDSENHDFSWNVVWDAATTVNERSWIAEIRIPFSQLRFNNTDQQTWGININRWRPFTTEDIFWVVVPSSGSGWISRFGDLTGIEGIKPARRLEILPYSASDGRFSNNVPKANPFSDGSDFRGRIGGDLKMGLGPNLTLDATFNPDFGQVEADPAEVNLTAYETFFSEKRPFFLEGRSLFDAIGQIYFYSRRIGGRPHGWAGGDFVDYPDNTTILGAAKITGRLQSGMSIGGLVAVADAEYAEVYDTTARSREKIKVEPTTSYGVIRIGQELGEGGSSASLILTGLKRNFGDSDELAELLPSQAVTGGLDYHLQFKDRTYSVYGHAGSSYVRGTKEAILAKQFHSTHYYQRPDATHVSVDSTRTSLSGYTGGLAIEKNGGNHWLWEVGTVFDSPGLDLNDVGAIGAADMISSWADLNYRETQPGKVFRNYRIGLEGRSEWNFGGDRQSSNIEMDFNGQWLNYWTTEASFSYHFGGNDDAMTRGGPLAGSPNSWSANAFVSNNFNAVTQYSLNSWYALNELGGYGWSIGGQLSSRIGDRIRLSVSPNYEVMDTKRQYIGIAQNNSTSETDYVFSNLKQSQLAMQIRGSYFFSPDLSLEFYSQPFAASGHFYNYGTLRAPRSKFLNPQNPVDPSDEYDAFPVRSDFGARWFRSNLVLRWEFLPGSTAYFVWQRNMNDDVDPGRLVRPGSLLDGFRGEGTDMVAIKISYWMPVS